MNGEQNFGSCFRFLTEKIQNKVSKTKTFPFKNTTTYQLTHNINANSSSIKLLMERFQDDASSFPFHLLVSLSSLGNYHLTENITRN